MPTRSPFPGMDPYLERYWGDVHASLIVYARDRLQPGLGGELRARAERRVIVETHEPDMAERRWIVPDVMVVESFQPSGELTAEPGGIALAEPLLIEIPELETTQRYIQIIDPADGDRVVTIIEFVSPTNKHSGDGRRQFQAKRAECLEAGVNFVEIDLTRDGVRELLVPWHRIPPSHRTSFNACVFRATHRHRFELYAMPLWRPLPSINIPLRPDDADVRLELQPLVDEVYERGRYNMDYAQPCEPPLAPADAAELAKRLAAGN